MNDLNKQYEEKEWVEQVIQLLRDIARASLSDLPKLPENISLRAIPLAKKAKSIQSEGDSQSGANAMESPEMEWVEQVRQLLGDLNRISLSDRPRLPEDLSQKALDLAKQGQRIKETAFEPTESTTFESTESTPAPQRALSTSQLESPGLLLDRLQKSLKIEWANSNHPDAPEWQQLINLLDIAKGLYQRIE